MTASFPWIFVALVLFVLGAVWARLSISALPAERWADNGIAVLCFIAAVLAVRMIR